MDVSLWFFVSNRESFFPSKTTTDTIEAKNRIDNFSILGNMVNILFEKSGQEF